MNLVISTEQSVSFVNNCLNMGNEIFPNQADSFKSSPSSKTVMEIFEPFIYDGLVSVLCDMSNSIPI